MKQVQERNTLASPSVVEEQDLASQTRKAPRTKELLAPEPPTSTSTRVPWYPPTRVPAHGTYRTSPRPAPAPPNLAAARRSSRKLGPLQLLPTLHQLSTPDVSPTRFLPLLRSDLAQLCSTSHGRPRSSTVPSIFNHQSGFHFPGSLDGFLFLWSCLLHLAIEFRPRLLAHGFAIVP